MTSKAGDYRNTRARFERGDWSVFVEPLDFKIIELLPDEGTNVGGLYQIGTTVKDLRDKLGANLITTSTVAARIRALHVLEMIRPVKLIGSGGGATGVQAWQQTTKGKETLGQWQSRQQ